MRLYHSTFSDHTATFTTPLTVLPPPPQPSFTLETMEAPTMVTNSPYSITVELEAPHRNFEAVHEGNYNTIGGYKLMMRTAEDVADDEDPIHVATLRPSEEFTFRSPCAASHPRTRTYTVEGLQPGSTYDFAVVALCCDPAGADSELSAYTTMETLPAVVPEPPANLQARPASWSEVALSWDEPDDHTFPIFEYMIYGAEAGHAPVLLGRTSLLEHTVSHLEADAAYRFLVVAVNCAGTSAAAEAQVATQPALPTITPEAVTVEEVSFFYCIVSWSYPAMRGADATGMELECFRDGAWAPMGTAALAETSRMQGDLEPGETYQVRCRTHSFAGPSEWSAPTPVQTRTSEMPGKAFPPRCVEGAVGLDAVTMQWGPELMADYDGPPVSHWELQLRDQTHAPWVTVAGEAFTATKVYAASGEPDYHFHRPAAVEASQHTFRGLAPGAEYGIRVRAVNEAGPGDWSEATTFVTQALAPGGDAGLEELVVVGEPQVSSL